MMPEVTPRGLEGRAARHHHYLVSYTLNDSAAVTARRMLGRVSTSSCPHSLPTQTARPRDPHALRERLEHDDLQQAFPAHHHAAQDVAEPRKMWTIGVRRARVHVL